MFKKAIFVLVLLFTVQLVKSSDDVERSIEIEQINDDLQSEEWPKVRDFGAYRVIVSMDDEGEFRQQRLTILKKGRIVFEEKDYDYSYDFGDYSKQSKDGEDLFSGFDITGKGIPNLVISKESTGTVCCRNLIIFELGNHFKKIAEIETYSFGIELIDFDHDGFPEVEFWEKSNLGQFICNADNPLGRVVLKFSHDHYEMNTSLMWKDLPSSEEMIEIKNKIIKGFSEVENPDYLFFDFLDPLVQFSYTGHPQFALQLIDEVWPQYLPNKEEFKKAFFEGMALFF